MLKTEQKNNYKTILKVIVGSQAHGLATPKSDFDYRGVFVVPTREILSLGNTKMNTNWNEGSNDDTSWEIGHFLNLATHCNPTILETFLAPVVDGWHCEFDAQSMRVRHNWTEELRDLFPYVWNTKDVMNAFIGYGLNQRKKFFDNKDKRASKYAVAYLRTLYQGWELLAFGTFTIKVSETEIGETLKRWKSMTPKEILEGHGGEVISECLKWEKRLRDMYEATPKKETDFEKINEFLLKVRKEFWI